MTFRWLYYKYFNCIRNRACHPRWYLVCHVIKYFKGDSLLDSIFCTWWMVSFLITVAPQITTHPQNLSVIEGSNVILSCNASGNPLPTISWTKSGLLITSSDEPQKNLNITNVNRTDSGEYRCVANNSEGNNTSNAATLDVLCKCRIPGVFFGLFPCMRKLQLERSGSLYSGWKRHYYRVPRVYAGAFIRGVQCEGTSL